MEPPVNPYQSPKVEIRSTPSSLAPPPPREGWKYILLAVAILGGLVSFVPWLAVALLALSTPVFLRYAIRSRRGAQVDESPPLSSRVAKVLGVVGLGASVLAASAGACLGTCTLTAWVTLFTGIPGQVSTRFFPEIYLGDISVAFFNGSAVGVVAFFTTAIWLFRRLWTPPSNALPE